MIAVITDPHWGDLLILGALIVGFVWLGYLGWRLIDLVIDAMQPDRPAQEYADFDHDPGRNFDRHFADARQIAVAGKDVAPEDEPSWPGKAPLLVPVATAPVPERFDLTSVLGVAGKLQETESETSGRHARVEADDNPTGLMVPVEDAPAVVDDEAAMEAVAAVSAPGGEA